MLKGIMIGLAGLWAGEASAQGCSEIRFASGAYSGEVAGAVSDGWPLCFRFGSGAGQTARLQIIGNENTCFTIPGVTDCQDDFSFRTRRQSYEVRVFQLFRAPGAENFRLRLTIR